MSERKTRAQSSDRSHAAEAEPLIDRIGHFMRRWRHRAEDILAILCGVVALVILLGLTGLTKGVLIDAWIGGIRRWLGWGGWIVPVIFFLLMLRIIRRKDGSSEPIPWARLITYEMLFFSLLGLLAMLDGLILPRAEAGEGGGIIGWGIATLFKGVIGEIGTLLLFLFLSLATGLYLSHRFLLQLSQRWTRTMDMSPSESEGLVSGNEISSIAAVSETEPKRSRAARLPSQYRKKFEVPELEKERLASVAKRDQRLPPYEILEGGHYARVSAQEINHTAGLIEKTLADFGLPVKVVDFRTGPSVTQYAAEPGYVEVEVTNGSRRRQKVRVSQITSLANDLALALSAPRVRIEAPVPGQAYVGIEVPNRKSSIVRLRPILESEGFQAIGSSLAIGLGRDVAGKAISADLAAMPHLLIAGTTGSGKSVCITALTTCLAFSNSPDDLKLVMIDPKMVELVRFNGLPHLIGKAETELERIVGVLRWCTSEMDRRYKLLEEARARDIDRYNQKMRRRKSAERLPRLVVMIDELADLMMTVPDQTERTLVRLAQMARATGIHLVVATQRPSTDVVTGLIKANFPARISFAVASSIDSRVILDTPGAETLLGHGDMLFLSPESSTPVRLQGAFVDDLEIERLIKYWRTAMDESEEQFSPEAPWEDLLVRQAALEDRDDIIEQAIEIVRHARHASASMLQRRLRIGYPRAARLMDELEELGIIGRPQAGGKTREVLIEKDEEDSSAQ